jgi:hypothetical protein
MEDFVHPWCVVSLILNYGSSRTQTTCWYLGIRREKGDGQVIVVSLAAGTVE